MELNTNIVNTFMNTQMLTLYLTGDTGVLEFFKNI